MWGIILFLLHYWFCQEKEETEESLYIIPDFPQGYTVAWAKNYIFKFLRVFLLFQYVSN